MSIFSVKNEVADVRYQTPFFAGKNPALIDLRP